MRRNALLLLFIFTGFFSYAQKVKGIVLDKGNNQPLEGVHVTLKKYNYSTITNKKGEFLLGLNTQISEQDTIFFSYVGYTTAKLTFSQIRERNFTVYMRENLEKLDEVNLSTTRKLKPKIHFEKLSSLDKRLYSFASIVVEDKIYVAGGNKSFEEDGMRREMETNPAATLDDLLPGITQNFLLEELQWKSTGV